MIDDATLLQRYAADRSEAAFAELVRRHLPLVYSAAVRRLGVQADRAGDATQMVFVALARNAARLARHPVLTGWLYTATRNAAINILRAENRRRAREQEACLMQETSLPSGPNVDWQNLRPVLDGAMDQLSETDREAILLRVFQNRTFAEVGLLLQLSEDGARKRVERALDKLAGTLGRRGITSTSAALASLLAAETTLAAPAGLAASVTGAAITGGAAAAAAFMSTAKLSLGLAALLLIGAATVVTIQQRAMGGLRDTQTQLQAQVTQLEREKAGLVTAHAAAQRETTEARAALDEATRKLAAPAPILRVSPAPVTKAPASPEEKAKLHDRYDSFLIGRLGLTPAQADRFVELKLAIFAVQGDLQAAMIQNGARGGTKEIEEMRRTLTKPMWDEIRELLGPGYAQYPDFEATSAYRPMVTAIFQPSGHALSDQQADDITRLVLQHTTSVRANATDLGTRSRVDWNAVAREAETLLEPAQLAALRAYAMRQAAP